MGPHRFDDAVPVATLTNAARVRAALIAPLDALADMPRLPLDEEQVQRVRHGRTLELAHPPGTIALVAHGELVAIGDADGERIQPRKVFSA
jgi:tRNA U55 pseudouridine synthase TruB